MELIIGVLQPPWSWPGQLFITQITVIFAPDCSRSALLCMLAFCMAIVTGPMQTFESPAASRIQVLRMYAIGLSLVIMLVETESPWVIERVKVLEFWIGRSILQGLLVVMTLEMATSAGESDFDLSIRLYR